MKLVQALDERLSGGVDLYVGLCEAAKKLGVRPELPGLSGLSEEALEQVSALVGLCRGRELSSQIDPIEAEAEFQFHDGVDLPTKEQFAEGRFRFTDSKPAELFGMASARYLLVRHIGPFMLARGEEARAERCEPGSSVRLRVESAPGALVNYRLATPEALKQQRG